MQMQRPRIKRVHYPQRFERTRQIRIGTTQVGVGGLIDDEDGSVWRLLHLMDGTRTVPEIVEQVAAADPQLDRDSIAGAVGELADAGYVEEAGWQAPPNLSAREIARYSRSEQYFSWVHTRPEASPYEVQSRLKAGRVAVLGLGGTGSHVALSLVAAGVGAVHCVDFDQVEEPNLARQILYEEEDVGAPKVERAVRRLRRLNSLVEVSGEDLCVRSKDDVARLMRGRDLLVLCADQPAHEIEVFTSDAALGTGCPWILAHYAGPMTVVSFFLPHRTPCYRCFWRTVLERDADVHGPYERLFPEDFQANAVIAPTAALTGQTAALEAIYFLGGLQPQTVGRVWHQNTLIYDHSYYFTPKRYADCEACSPKAPAPQ